MLYLLTVAEPGNRQGSLPVLTPLLSLLVFISPCIHQLGIHCDDLN